MRLVWRRLRKTHSSAAASFYSFGPPRLPQVLEEPPRVQHRLWRLLATSSAVGMASSSVSVDGETLVDALPADEPAVVIDSVPVSTHKRPFASILDLPHVRVRDRAAVEEKLASMVDGGHEKLLVISDFDHTLSKAHEKGVRCWTTHGIFDNEAERVKPKFAQKLQDLTRKYIAIEFDPHMTVEEKTPHMESWWNESHKMIVEEGFTLQMIEEFVTDATNRQSVNLRDGAEKLLADYEELDIPVIVFSAGIGDIIEIFLRVKLGRVPPNVHVISNMMKFDTEGSLIAFSEPLIHVFCKNSSVISPNAPFYEHLNRRHNVVLMGDSLGDLHMDVGVKDEHTVLRIGFLNFKVDELLPKYLEGYDIVVVDDQSTHVPQLILDLIRGL